MDDARRTSVLILGAAVAVGAGLRLSLALGDDGIYWPDEIYQSLEPAHRWVFGYGFVPWEFIQGARSWAFPGFVGGLLFLARALGADAPALYLVWIRGAFAVLGALTAIAVYGLARTHGADRPAALGGAVAWSLGAVFVYFAPRAMGENLSALLVAAGLALALPAASSRAHVGWGALLLGLAVALRLQNGIFCGVLLATWAARRRREPFLMSGAVLLAAAFGVGLLDRLTWGSWFHSAVEYLRFNVVEGGAAQWGTAGPGYYFSVLVRSMPFLTLTLLLLAGLGARRSRGLALAIALFLGAHVAVPHKELRFLLPALPLLCALAAVGVTSLQQRLLRVGALGLWGMGACISAVTAHALTFGELGQYADAKAKGSAYDDFGPVNRLLKRAYTESDLCGLKVEGVHLAWTGGYSYLHRPIPMYGGNGPARDEGFFNYVITPLASARGAVVRAREGNFALARLPNPGCVRDPHFSWRLP